MCRIEKFLNLATKLVEARENPMRFPFACIITQGSRVISVGYNRKKTSPFSKKTRESFLHAELDALKRAGNDARGGTIFIVRKTFLGYGVARPCPICHHAIVAAGLKKVVFTTTSHIRKYEIIKL